MAVGSRSGAIRAGIWEIVSSKVFAEMHKTAVLARHISESLFEYRQFRLIGQ